MVRETTRRRRASPTRRRGYPLLVHQMRDQIVDYGRIGEC